MRLRNDIAKKSTWFNTISLMVWENVMEKYQQLQFLMCQYKI